MQTRTFTGRFFPQATRRVAESVDPVTGTTQRIPYMLDKLEGAVIYALIGYGEFSGGPTAGEKYVTVHAQYAPGLTARITVSSQNVEPFKEKLLRNNLITTEKQGEGENAVETKLELPWALKTEHKVTVMGRVMQDRNNRNSREIAIQAEEVYLNKPDGTFETIIGAPVPETAATKKGSTVEDLFV